MNEKNYMSDHYKKLHYNDRLYLIMAVFFHPCPSKWRTVRKSDATSGWHGWKADDDSQRRGTHRGNYSDRRSQTVLRKSAPLCVSFVITWCCCRHFVLMIQAVPATHDPFIHESFMSGRPSVRLSHTDRNSAVELPHTVEQIQHRDLHQKFSAALLTYWCRTQLTVKWHIFQKSSTVSKELIWKVRGETDCRLTLMQWWVDAMDPRSSQQKWDCVLDEKNRI